MYDIMLKYCPSCGGEFRPEIQSCGICEVPLVSGAEMQAKDSEREAKKMGRSGTLTGGEEMVQLHRAPLADLRYLEGMLAEERIAVRISAEEGGCKKGCGPPMFVMEVSKVDAQDAARIVEQEYRRMTALDDHLPVAADAVFNPEEEETTCPACGFKFPPTTTECPDCGLNFG